MELQISLRMKNDTEKGKHVKDQGASKVERAGGLNQWIFLALLLRCNLNDQIQEVNVEKTSQVQLDMYIRHQISS